MLRSPRPPIRARALACALILAAGGSASAQTTPGAPGVVHHETHAAPHRAPVHPDHHATHHHAAPTHHHPAAKPAAKPVPPPPPPAAPTPPPPPPPKPVGAVTGLPLPRFAALRSDDVNLRSGPGTRYPILWVYKRRDLPVQIEREFDVWRLIEDQDGTKGWVNQATLIGTRTFVALAPPTASNAPPDAAAGTTDPIAALRAKPADDAAASAYLRPGVIGRILACGHTDDWCRVSVRGVTGYFRRQTMYGLEPGEDVAPPG